MSRVRIYQCTTYKKQNILSPDDEPLELHTWENLLFVTTKCSFIEIYNMSSLQLVARFCTISRAETIIYSEYGNCIVTLERASDILHCFVRLYMGFPCHLRDLLNDTGIRESFLMIDREIDVTDKIGKYLTGEMTKQGINRKEITSSKSLENWDVERVELPTQGAVNCIGMCSHTGFLAVAWDTSITLYVLTQDTDSTPLNSQEKRDKSIRCEVTILMEMEIGFVVTRVALEDIYLACMSEFEVQVFKLSLMPDRYTCIPKEKKLDSESRSELGVGTLNEDGNEPEIRQSEDFIRLSSFYSYPTLHLNARSNGGEAECHPNILDAPTILREEGSSSSQGGFENHCIVFPSVSKEKTHSTNKDEQNKRMMEIWGPRRLIGNRALKATTPDGHKLTNSGISTMLYLKLPFATGKSTEYSFSTSTIDQGDKNIDMFHTIKLVPEYIYEGDKQHLVGICLLVASKKEGHFYDILDFCRKVITFPFTKDLIDIVLSPGLMHVVYVSGIEVYITRSYGVASENARNLLKQGKVYDIEIASSVTTPVDHFQDSVPFSQHTPSVPTEGSDSQSPLYWLHQVTPSTQEMDISQIGQSSFVNLTSCGNTNHRIAILSKLKPEVKSSGSFAKLVRKNSPKIEEIIWSIYILDIVPLHSIAKQMEMMAQPYINENPPIYFQLISDAHFLRKSALSGANKALWEENEVECANVEGSIESLIISLNPSRVTDENEVNLTDIANKRELLGLQKSCLLIADFLRPDNEQLALEYYKQGFRDINQFLQNSILHITTTPATEDATPESMHSSMDPSTLKNMANTMCFNQSDASSLVKSIMHIGSLQSENSDSKSDDSIVYKVFNLCVYLENKDEMKAKESVCELFLHSKEFSIWANDHIHSFVSKENDGNLSLLAMFLLIETPSLMIPLFPKMCQMELVKAGSVIELIKHNTEDTDRDEMVIYFITDLIRVQASVEKRIAEFELALLELITICFKLFEFQIELDTRQFDSVCAEYRSSWLDSFPPFGGNQLGNMNTGKGTAFIFLAQNILCSPFNSLELSEKILELTTSSEHYEGIRAIIYLKLSRYKELVIIFLNRYQNVFPKLCESIKVNPVNCAIIRCIVNEILVNTSEDDMLSQEMRETVCYFIVSLTRHMNYDEIMQVLPEHSPADLYKRCFNFHLQMEKSNLIVQELCNSTL